MTPEFLVLGKAGQVARALATAAGPDRVIALGREELDLADLGAIAPAIGALRPALVINAAAYTAVDAAEKAPDAAFRLNRDAPAEIARACAALEIPLVHVSTDFVFDGAKGAPYVEADPVSPLSVYGRSKADGEAAVAGAGGKTAILRTSWVYAAEGGNFVRTMLRLARERGVVRVVDDQRSRPTWARDVAEALLLLGRRLRDREPEAEGVFHFSNAGEATWADLAEAAIDGAARRGAPSARVERIATVDFPTPARRPADSRLDCSRFFAFSGAAPPDWRASLERCLDEMTV